jgi:transcriptional regulator with XRE-family HTH domain
MEIDKWIVAARDAKGLTQGQLADALGVTRGNVSGWENRRHEPSLSQIRKIGTLCGVDATALLTDADQGITKLPSRDAWPFSFPLSLFESLPPNRRREIELMLLGFIAETNLRDGESAKATG